MRHSLSDRDPVARTATCAVCGPVETRPAGAGWVCLNKKRANEAAWRERNPERVSAGRNKKSPHHLLTQDRETRTGTCPICGPVDIVPFGRGFACATRASELRSSVQEEMERCLWCRRVGTVDHPIRDGRCQYHFVGFEYAQDAHTEGGYTDADLRFEQAVGSDWNGESGTGYSWVPVEKYEKDAPKVRVKRGPRLLGEPVPKDEWKKWNDLLAAEGL